MPSFLAKESGNDGASQPPIKKEPEDEEIEKICTDSMKAESFGDSEKSMLRIDPKTYCTLGHYHLLLEEFEKGTYH